MKKVLSINNKKGLTIVECIIALLLTTVAVVSLVSMQSLAWRGAGKSDYIGSATGLLQRELERNELLILKKEIPPNDEIYFDKNGNEINMGDSGVVFTINIETTTPNTIPVGTRLLSVQVKWPGSKNGIRSSIIVLPQTDF